MTDLPTGATPHAMIGRELGNYVVRSLLGEGGMGAVFAGEHRFLGTRVAIKVLHGNYSSNTEVSQRFFQEAKSSIEIGHPNIIRILDFGQSSDGALYLVMELLEGGSLGQTVAQSGVFDEGQTARIGIEIANALAASHKKGIVHRDLKPDNVFLTAAGEVKVLDFGIAKIADSGGGTKTGSLLGTPQYMAPEQARGAKLVGPHSDVYALGGILFFMLTGRAPFLGESVAELLTKTLFEDPPRASSLVTVGNAMDSLIVQCLAKDPPARPADMEALVEQLGKIQNGAPFSSLARPISVSQPLSARSSMSGMAGQLVNEAKAEDPPRRRSVLIPVLGVAVLAVAGGLLWAKPKASAPTVMPAHEAVVPVAPAPVPAATPAVHAHPKVVVRSEPPGATIYLDGNDLGTTPALLDLELPQEVKLQLRGYLPAQEVITSAEGTLVKLTPEPKKSSSKPAHERSHATGRETGGGVD